jgi:hypothetical protein
MRIRKIVMAGLGAGAVALALAGCTGGVGDRGDGQGLGQNGGQGYRGARYAQTQQGQAQAARDYGRGQQAQSAEGSAVEPTRGALRGTGEYGQGAGTGRGTGAGRAEIDSASNRTGRDIADIGTVRTLTGTLSNDGTEWYLDTSDRRFLLHMGNASYVEQTGIALEAGQEALVKGLVDAVEVSVVSIQLDGQTYAFRSEDGRPLWAGNGRGAGRGAGRGTGTGLGRGGGSDA